MSPIRKFNWVQRPTTWQYAQAWKSHRQQMAQRFLNDSAAASSAFLNAQGGMIDGMATLAAQAAILRSQSQIAAARSKLLDQLA